MRKTLQWSVLIFIVYGVLMSLYLFYGAGKDIPAIYKGTSADPSVFMNERQLELSYEYSRIRHVLFFLTTPFEWLALISILTIGISVKFRKWAESITQIKLFQNAIFAFYYTLLITIIFFPIKWISYTISKSYGISSSSFTVWMKDQLINYWLEYFMMFLIVTVIYFFIKRKKKRWWFYVWLVSVPFTLLVMFVKPVIIDPLYNDFYPLKDQELESKILDIASQAEIPANHVYEVNMSEKTNALNAYVTGIGSNSRIVLWDTTLQKLSDEEILFVMAHEMAHYVKKHVYIGVLSYLAISLLGFYITAKVLNWVINRWGNQLRIKGLDDIATLPLILLIFSILSFGVSPFSNAVSRYQERSADKYAIEMTKNSEAAIGTFQTLTVSGLSEVNPPLIVKWFRYGHPTMLERLNFIEEYETEKSSK